MADPFDDLSNAQTRDRQCQVGVREVVVAITNGRLDFGTWERTFYGSSEGRRRQRVPITLIGE